MNLHHDKEVFEELVVAASNELAISANVISCWSVFRKILICPIPQNQADQEMPERKN
jgi:hypothetical protein